MGIFVQIFTFFLPFVVLYRAHSLPVLSSFLVIFFQRTWFQGLEIWMALVSSIFYHLKWNYWRRKWQLTPLFLLGESHGRKSLVGYSPWGCKESDTSERLHFHFQPSAETFSSCVCLLLIVFLSSQRPVTIFFFKLPIISLHHFTHCCLIICGI